MFARQVVKSPPKSARRCANKRSPLHMRSSAHGIGNQAVLRQANPAPTQTGAAAGPMTAQVLTWGDFAAVPNKINGMSANTSWTWHFDGTNFTVAFDPGGSWSVVADQTPDLLRHEQYHLNLAVLVANKANAAQAAGTLTGAALVSAFKTTLAGLESSYDSDTQHGTNARMQTMWENDIDAGVPSFPFP